MNYQQYFNYILAPTISHLKPQYYQLANWSFIGITVLRVHSSSSKSPANNQSHALSLYLLAFLQMFPYFLYAARSILLDAGFPRSGLERLGILGRSSPRSWRH